MISLQNLLQFQEVIVEKSGVVLVDFYADWCEPCKWLDEILSKLEPRLPEEVVILKVDIEKFPELQRQFSVRGIPVIALFKDGKLVWRMNGFLVEEELLEKVNAVLSGTIQ